MMKNKGITLIALVITIIVLLILAGVAISMLSGENGILKKAAEAKTKTEDAQRKEEMSIATMDLETYFITNNLQYKAKYGIITGIKPLEKVKQLEDDLPDGYKVTTKMSWTGGDITDTPIEESEKETLEVGTGMKIEKDGKEVARVVVYGDVNGSDGITSTDSGYIQGSYLNQHIDVLENNFFIKEAMDVNHDGYIAENTFEIEIDGKTQTIESDTELITKWSTGDSIINQDCYTKSSNPPIALGNWKIIDDFIRNLSQEFKDNYGFTETGNGGFTLNKVTNQTQVEDILALVPKITIRKIPGNTVYTTGTLPSGKYRIDIPRDKYGYTGKIENMGSFTVN